MALRRGFRFIPALICMAVIFWFSSQPGEDVTRAAQPIYHNVQKITGEKSVKISWPKVGHFVGYSAFGLALLYGLGAGNGSTVLQSIGFTSLYAVSDEIHQTFTPGRSASFADVVLDTAAAALAILLCLLLLRVVKAACSSKVRK